MTAAGLMRVVGPRIALIAFAFMSTLAAAQTYPSKTLRIISPYPPGGGNDILARAISPKLGEFLGQQVIVENRPGANTIIGTEAVAKSPPDGYTMILVPSSHAINSSLYKKLPYDAIKDFSPITLVGSGPLILVVHPSLPIRSVRELVAFARTHPDALTYGSAGNGASGHLAGVLFGNLTSTRLAHIPYKGTAPVVTELLGGQISMAFGTSLAVLPHVKNGKLRALASCGSQRTPAAPELPTVSESGVGGYAASLWYGLLAPAHTPHDIVTRLNHEVTKVLALPDVRERIGGQGVDPYTSTPEEFARVIAVDLNKWERVVKASGAQID
jgi:tripartite-type tricarboxylate transporter receptor subunit TctC